MDMWCNVIAFSAVGFMLGALAAAFWGG